MAFISFQQVSKEENFQRLNIILYNMICFTYRN